MQNIEEKNVYRGDFDARCELEGLTQYSEEKVNAFIGAKDTLIQKSEVEELSKEDSDQLTLMKSEIGSLEKCVVLNDDFTQETLYFRKSK